MEHVVLGPILKLIDSLLPIRRQDMKAAIKPLTELGIMSVIVLRMDNDKRPLQEFVWGGEASDSDVSS